MAQGSTLSDCLPDPSFLALYALYPPLAPSTSNTILLLCTFFVLCCRMPPQASSATTEDSKASDAIMQHSSASPARTLPGGKRPCIESPVTPLGADGIRTRKEFTSMLEESNKRMQKFMANENTEVLAQYEKAILIKFDLLKDTVTETNIEVEAIKNKQIELADNIGTFKSDLQAEMQEMRDIIAARPSLPAAGPPPPDLPVRSPPTSPHFNRDARPDVLSIGVEANASKEMVLSTIKEWLSQEPNIAVDDYDLEGPTYGRNFELQFHGSSTHPDTGAKRAAMANLSLRNEDGTWRKLYATGPKNVQLAMFISKDASPKHNREAILAKRLSKAIERNIGEEKGITFHRPSRTLKHNGRLLAKVECKSFEEFEVKWMLNALEASKINKEEVLKDFYSHVGIAPDCAWSC